MNNEEYEDFEQVYIVSDREEFENNPERSRPQPQKRETDHSQFQKRANDVSQSQGSGFSGIIVFAIVVVVFVVLLSTLLSSNMIGIRYKDMAIPLILGTLMFAYVAFSMCISSLPDQPKIDHKRYEGSVRQMKKRAKFDNLNQPRSSLLNKGSNISNKPPVVDHSLSGEKQYQTEAEVNNKKIAEIELAVEALVRLGFGAKKAKDWVIRGFSAGIETSDTQGLIKFALSSGASIKRSK